MSMVTEVRIPKYALLEFRVWTGGAHIHSSPVCRLKAEDICEYWSVSGQETITMESINCRPQCDTESIATEDPGEMRVVNPIANSHTPIIIHRYTPYFGRSSPIVLNRDPYAAKTSIVAMAIPSQTGRSPTLIRLSPGPITDVINPITNDRTRIKAETTARYPRTR